MQHAEFEERDFESSLYHQLCATSTNLWTPGQVFEHHFGIDAALKTQNTFLVASLNHTCFPRGVVLDHLRWGYVWRSLGKKRRLPTFEVNALLQAKRPQHLKGSGRGGSSRQIAGSHWRFTVDA